MKSARINAAINVARAAVILLRFWGLVMTFKTVETVLHQDVLGQDAHAGWLAGQGELQAK